MPDLLESNELVCSELGWEWMQGSMNASAISGRKTIVLLVRRTAQGKSRKKTKVQRVVEEAGRGRVSQLVGAVIKNYATIGAAKYVRRCRPRSRVGAEEGRQVESFIDRAARLDRAGQTSAGLDLLYDRIDESMRRGRLAALDAALGGVVVAELSADMLLGILTATLPVKKRLPERARLFRETEAVLKARNEFEDGLLTGLEG